MWKVSTFLAERASSRGERAVPFSRRYSARSPVEAWLAAGEPLAEAALTALIVAAYHDMRTRLDAGA